MYSGHGLNDFLHREASRHVISKAQVRKAYLGRFLACNSPQIYRIQNVEIWHPNPIISGTLETWVQRVQQSFISAHSKLHLKWLCDNIIAAQGEIQSVDGPLGSGFVPKEK